MKPASGGVNVPKSEPVAAPNISPKAGSEPASGAFSAGVLLAVGAGGAVGAFARYGTGLAIPPPSSGHPLATFLVNIVGAAILGVLSAIPSVRLRQDSRLRVLIGTGFCGGLTTFSTMSLEVATRWGVVSGLAVAYLTVSVISAPLAVAVGRAAGKRAFPEPPPPPAVSGEPPDLPPDALDPTGPGVR